MNRFNRWIYPLTVWLSQLAIRLSFIVITVDEAHVPKQGPGLLAQPRYLIIGSSS
ncbi:hypothetical protein HMI55_001968 [Coelomomyces lativittatus]|nr:hypothetical protein HMI55_001968 [Coelomomyces lativittatus]